TAGTYRWVASYGGDANNSAANGACNDPNESVSVTSASADVAVTKVDAPDPVAAGQLLTYTLTVSNSGPSSATGVTLTDALPGNVAINVVTYSQGTCTGYGPITCSVATLASGASATITIQVRPGTA